MLRPSNQMIMQQAIRTPEEFNRILASIARRERENKPNLHLVRPVARQPSPLAPQRAPSPNNNFIRPYTERKPTTDNQLQEFKAHLERLMHSPLYGIGMYYRVEATSKGIYIRESSRHPPNAHAQAQFRKLRLQELAGYLAVFQIEELPQKKALLPSWDFFPSPNKNGFDTNAVLEIFNETLKVQCTGEFLQYVSDAKARLQIVSPLVEENLGETFVSPISQNLLTIPVSFPDNPDIILDLCSDVLRMHPERDGKILNPYTNQFWHLKDLISRPDVVDILSDRIQAEQNPKEFLNNLLVLQRQEYAKTKGDNKLLLADSVKKKLASLKAAQYDKVLKELESPVFIAKQLSESKDQSEEMWLFVGPLFIYHIGLGRMTPLSNAGEQTGTDLFFKLLADVSPEIQADKILACCDNLDNFVKWLNVPENKVHLTKEGSVFGEERYLALLKELKCRQAIEEFEARYGIHAKTVVVEPEGSITFLFTDQNYKTLLAEYENKPQTLPLSYVQEGDTWRVTLSNEQYNEMVRKNKENLNLFLSEFKKYKTHLEAEPSIFKRTVLKQRNLVEKKAVTSDLIAMLEDKTKEGINITDAAKLIAFKKVLPSAMEKLGGRRDERLWVLLKMIVTGLTLGVAHVCFKIWAVEGRELVSQTNKELKPTKSP